MTPTVILFTKAPRWGTVKSRLAARIGSMAALRFHRTQVGRMIRRLSTPRWRLVLAVTPDGARGPWTAGLPVLPQGRGDLGARMLRCLNRQRGPAVLIGSDIPGVTAAHISHALTLLRGADVVFGPAEDGGFWLLGLRHAIPEDTFAGVEWSTGQTLADCMARVPGRSALAHTLADVDDNLCI
ncbi:MAG: TIGR04282 family arsenosugar biosynthesis glycosyltransferase [Rhodospirillaceae bacterium]